MHRRRDETPAFAAGVQGDTKSHEMQLEEMKQQIAALVNRMNQMTAPVITKALPISAAINSPERFPREVIADRIKGQLDKVNFSIKELADCMNLSLSAAYKKVGEANPFSISEVDFIGRLLNAPIGWPFIEWDLGVIIEREIIQGKNRR